MRIRGAVTDSVSGITYDPAGRPGTANLLDLLSACTGEDASALAARFADHGRLKDALVDALVETYVYAPLRPGNHVRTR